MAKIMLAARHLVALVDFGGLLVFGFHRGDETGGNAFQRDAAFGTLRSGHAWHDGGKLQLQRVGEDRVFRRLGAEQALRLGVFLDQLNARLLAAGIGQVIQRLAVDREEAAGRAIFGRHVGDGGAVGQRHGIKAGAEELDKLADNALLAQHLRDGEHQIGRRDAFLDLAGQLEADDFRDQHRLRLAEHRGFRLNAADAPAQNRQAVDHGRVRIRAHESVRIGDFDRLGLLALGDLLLARPDGLRQIFEIHLMADAGAGRHDAEILERLLAPFQEPVALAVAGIFEIHILLQRLVGAELVDNHRMVDDQVDRHQRIDLLRIAAQRLHRIAHGGKIHHRRNAGEILHQYAGRAEGDFLARLALVLQPGGEGLDVFLGDG